MTETRNTLKETFPSMYQAYLYGFTTYVYITTDGTIIAAGGTNHPMPYWMPAGEWVLYSDAEYHRYHVSGRNPDYSSNCESSPVTIRHLPSGAKCTMFRDVSKEIWDRECPKYGVAPLSYMTLECPHGHRITLYRGEAVSQ